MAETTRAPLHQDGGSTPIPDPTVLSTAAIKLAVDQLAALVDAKVTSLANELTARIVALEHDGARRDSVIERVPAAIAVQTATLEKLHDEKFRSVETQFIERDVRVKEAATATATAVNAALQAAKEAVGEQNKSFTLSIDKSEKATGEQITQQRAQISTLGAGLDGKIDDLKQRVTRIESVAVGRVNEKVETHTNSAWMLSLVVGGISAAGLIITLIITLGKGGA